MQDPLRRPWLFESGTKNLKSIHTHYEYKNSLHTLKHFFTVLFKIYSLLLIHIYNMVLSFKLYIKKNDTSWSQHFQKRPYYRITTGLHRTVRFLTKNFNMYGVWSSFLLYH